MTASLEPDPHAREGGRRHRRAARPASSAARYLKKHGFHPVVFEASAAIGGQWNAASPSSAVWPGMRTNTSRVLTAFSDLDHPSGTNVYPEPDRYAGLPAALRRAGGLTPHLRLSTPSRRLGSRPGEGWIVRSRCGDSVSVGTLFARRRRDGILQDARHACDRRAEGFCRIAAASSIVPNIKGPSLIAGNPCWSPAVRSARWKSPASWRHRARRRSRSPCAASDMCCKSSSPASRRITSLSPALPRRRA